jgi:hypothetical protein
MAAALVHSIGKSTTVVTIRQRAAPTKSLSPTTKKSAAVACSICMLISTSIYSVILSRTNTYKKSEYFHKLLRKTNNMIILLMGKAIHVELVTHAKCT